MFFSLNYRNKKALEFDRMKAMVDQHLAGEESQPVVISDQQIRRDRDHNVVTIQLQKTFKVTEDKRMIPSPGSYISYPYGY